MADELAEKTGFSPKQLETLQTAFDMFDKDGDRTVDAGELKSTLRALGYTVTDDEIKKMMNEVDEDQSGKIEFPEFCQLISNRFKDADIGNVASEEEVIREVFQFFDRDGNGTISRAELRHIMTCMGERLSDQDINDMIEAADVNGDGEIDYKEFSALLNEG